MSAEVKADRKRKRFGVFKVLYFGSQLNISLLDNPIVEANN